MRPEEIDVTPELVKQCCLAYGEGSSAEHMKEALECFLRVLHLDRPEIFAGDSDHEKEIRRLAEELRKSRQDVARHHTMGVIDGLYVFAWMKDGVSYVGSGISTFKQALKEARDGKYDFKGTGYYEDLIDEEVGKS